MKYFVFSVDVVVKSVAFKHYAFIKICLNMSIVQTGDFIQYGSGYIEYVR